MPKCRVFAIDDNLKEIVADGLYGKHMFGASVSVAVVKFVAAQGHDLPAKSHSHGEEASLQLLGGCSVFESSDSEETDLDLATIQRIVAAEVEVVASWVADRPFAGPLRQHLD